MNRTKTATLLFEILAKSFEKNDIKEFHYILNGVRAVVHNKVEGQDYQITLRPIVDPQDDIDLDDMAQKHASTVQYSGMMNKGKK